MVKRKSIHIEGFAHKNPIPAASRLGNGSCCRSVTERESFAPGWRCRNKPRWARR